MALRHLLSVAVAGSVVFGLVDSAKASMPQKIFRLDHGAIPLGPFAPGQLVYYGGRVLSNVKIVSVSWGSSVDATYMTNLGGFYTAITKSPFIDWMMEYDTLGLTGYVDGLPGSKQHIGRGGYAGEFVLALQHTSSSVNDDDIQTELAYQLGTGGLPAPELDSGGNVNSLYMVDFPSGISMPGACSSFGAYHGTFIYKGLSVPYGVHPNCGYSFDTSTIIHSHELAEAMTDMEVGLNTQAGPCARPLAWGTVAPTGAASYEAGDLCQGTSATIAGYVVQKIWSNYANGCVAEIPICDGVLVAPACRPCTAYDDGAACEGSKPACATQGPSQGQCVQCTSAYPNACVETLTDVCDDPSYTCVGCLANKDCGGASPVCDLTKKTCRPCAADNDCDKGTVCDRSSDGAQGHCVQCTSDVQCPAGGKCDPATHACLPPPAPDAGGPPDAGIADQPPPAADTGCACDIASPASGTKQAMLALVAVTLIVRRRRRPTLGWASGCRR
jgi:MYXO-CTERM domain-containing protein